MKALEDAIVARIIGAVELPAAAKVLAWPDRPLELNRPVGSAAILVRFMGVSKSVEASPNRRALCQTGSISIEARFLVKDLRSHVGAYSLMQVVEDLLGAWKPAGEVLDPGYSASEPGAYLANSQLVAHDQSVWDWGQQYQIPVMYVKRRANGA